MNMVNIYQDKIGDFCISIINIMVINPNFSSASIRKNSNKIVKITNKSDHSRNSSAGGQKASLYEI